MAGRPVEANTHCIHSHQACFVAARLEFTVELLNASSEDEMNQESFICYAGHRRASVCVKNHMGVTAQTSLQVPFGRAGWGSEG